MVSLVKHDVVRHLIAGQGGGGLRETSFRNLPLLHRVQITPRPFSTTRVFSIETLSGQVRLVTSR